jgi:multiple sugar transport system permease protein
MGNKTGIKKLLRWNQKKSDIAFGYVLLFPAIFVLALVVFYPIVKGVFMSFFEYTFFTLNNPRWNNFKNYLGIIKDGALFLYLRNTVIFACGVVLIQFVLAMIIALLLNSKVLGPVRNFFRSAFLLPWTIPSVVTAILWAWLFQPQYGLVNYFLRTFGVFRDMSPQWLANPQLAMVTIMIACVWRYTPYMIIMILAGLQGVRTDLLEAASLDGANVSQVFFYVTLPSIKQVLGTTVLVAVLNAFQQFTIIYNMTAGGPLGVTTTLSLAAYKAAFQKYDIGAGSAIGVIWLIILVSLTTIFNARTKRFDE